MKISELKKEAKVKLSGKLGKAIGINVIFMILSFVLGLISGFIPDETVSSILSLLISILLVPFSFGLTAAMMKLSRNEEVSLFDFVTIGLKNIGKVYKVYLRMFLKLLLPIILYIVAVVLMVAGIILTFSEAVSTASSVMLLAGIILLIVACIMYVMKSLLYMLPLYLLVDNPEASTKDLLNKSAELMKGNRWKAILVELSFIGWYLLIFGVGIVAGVINAILGVILLYGGIFVLIPYVTFTLINFYEDLAGIGNVQVENTVPDPVEE